ncbi:MAG: hypothetical protein HYY62_05920 [Deltaproteobacteria bacterium]|nr:hypothetical protein [Deltaproteobacteria bacterium]
MSKGLFWVSLLSLLGVATITVGWAKSIDQLEISYLNRKMGTADRIQVHYLPKKQWRAKRWKNSLQIQEKKIREFDYLRLKLETETFLKEEKSKKMKAPAQKCVFEFQLQSLTGCADQNQNFLKLWHDYVEIFY